MKYLIYFVLCFSQLAFAGDAILLVASKATPSADYKKICQQKGYLCFPFAYKQVLQSKTMHFDQLIENFDTDNKSYVSQFAKNVKLSLKEDDLTLAQIKNLIFASEKLHQIQTTTELKKIYAVIDKLQDEESDRLIFIAGKMIANNFKNKSLLESYFDKLKYAEVDYMSVSENGEKKYFLNGDCDHPRYTEMISQLDQTVIPHFPEGCNLTQRYDWGSDLMKDHFSQNKNKYAMAAAALVTMFFLKSYDISIGGK